MRDFGATPWRRKTQEERDSITRKLQVGQGVVLSSLVVGAGLMAFAVYQQRKKR